MYHATICSACRNYILILSSFMTYDQVCNKSNTTGATSGAGTLLTRPEQRSFFVGFVLLNL